MVRLGTRKEWGEVVGFGITDLEERISDLFWCEGGGSGSGWKTTISNSGGGTVLNLVGTESVWPYCVMFVEWHECFWETGFIVVKRLSDQFCKPLWNWNKSSYVLSGKCQN